MTRNNNSKPTYTTSQSTLRSISSIDENFNLPDLSGLREDEKQHILSVLLRDENLRNKHLSRFIQLKKEVAELENQSQTKSPNVCARCHAPFGFLFNTGDLCPKCGAKVCKQCRLMYNGNDNGWVCQLCCKQMQLLSYSGEWIYSQQNNNNNNRTDSISTSEVIRKSLSPPVSFDEREISSSETETEDVPYLSNRNLTSSQRTISNQQLSNNNNNPLVIQTGTDEDKLNTIKQNAQKRSYNHIVSTQQSRQSPSTAILRQRDSFDDDDDNDDADSVFHQSTTHSERSIPPAIQINSTNQQQGKNTSIRESTTSISTINTLPDNNYLNKPDDCDSVTSSEWGLESERGEPTTPVQRNASIKSDSKRSLSSRMHLTGSIQSIREAAHRFPKPHLSGSRTSLNSERKSQIDSSDNQSKSSMYPTWSSG